MQRLIPVLALLTLTATAAAGGTREKIVHEGVRYEVFRCAPEELRVFWKNEAGESHGNFARLHADLATRGERLVFAMNAGIFEPDGAPSGLHIEADRELHPLNRADGKGNFFLKPNGVFFIDQEGARIIETEEYARSGAKPRLAVQSGPLLLRAGDIHPAFRADSTNRLHRNGVGILPDGSVIFAITEFDLKNGVNLHDFAEFFRAQGCRDALFLDGDLSLIWTPEDGPPKRVNNLGAIFGVTERD